MPGGLTRIAAEPGGTVVSMQQAAAARTPGSGAGQRDNPMARQRSVELPVKLVRGSHDLPSRVADNLYWFGRYVERTEDTTRLLRAALSRTGSAAGFGASEELPLGAQSAEPPVSSARRRSRPMKRGRRRLPA